MRRSEQIGVSITPQLKKYLEGESSQEGVSLSTIAYRILLNHYKLEESKPQKRPRKIGSLLGPRDQILKALPVDQFFNINQIKKLSGNTSYKVQQVLEVYPNYFQVVDTPKGVRIRRLSRRERREQREIKIQGLRLANISRPEYQPSERKIRVTLTEEIVLALWVEHKLSQICSPEEVAHPHYMEEVLRDAPERITPEEYLEIIKPIQELYKGQESWAQ